MSLKDDLKQAKYLKYDDKIYLFDYIYFMPTRKKHSSGYYMYEIIGSVFDKKCKKEKFYSLSKCSDVIDFTKIKCKYDWFCSVDMPEYNVYRLFTRKGYKFYTYYFHLSTFDIEVVEEV